VPKAAKTITVQAPEEHFNNLQESKALYQFQTKIMRNLFKLDATNKAINIDVIIYFSGKLSSKNARQRPFMFTMPLNFSQKE